MEHLFDDTEREKVVDKLERFEWLGFDHDSSQEFEMVPIADYAKVRGIPDEGIFNNSLEPGAITLITNEEHLKLLQSWLFFGVLEQIMGVPVPSAAFLAKTDKGTFLHTTLLRKFLNQFQHALLNEWRGLPDVMESCAACLTDAMVFSIRWDRYLLNVCDSMLISDPAIAVIYHSIHRLNALVSESLYTLHEYLLEHSHAAFPDLAWTITQKTKSDLHGRLVSQGWCPSALPAADSMGLSAVYYAAISASDDAGESQTLHSRCSESKCVINDIDPASYKPKHTKNCDGTSCHNVTADIEELKKYLKNGVVPVINLTTLLISDHSLSEPLPTLPISEHTPFVAISHVWAHGRGSSAERGLPSCQVRDFLKLVLAPNSSLNIYTPYIWIDSLCIPEDKETRSRAIQLMASVYQNAAVTLILDDAMQTLQEPVPADEFLLRLYLSDWNRRLWTFQEAALSKNLFVATASSLVKVTDKLRTSFLTGTRTAVGQRMGGYFLPFLLNNIKNMEDVAKYLRFRSSSKQTDESLAVALIVKVDPLLLTGLKGEERYAAFWRALGKVPLGIITAGSKERLTVPGFGWAPKTLMWEQSHVDLSGGENDAVVTDLGLQASYYVLKLKDRARVTNSEMLLAVDPNGNHYGVIGVAGSLCDVWIDTIIVANTALMLRGKAAAAAVGLTELLDGDWPHRRFNYVSRYAMKITDQIKARKEQDVVECFPLEKMEIIVS